MASGPSLAEVPDAMKLVRALWILALISGASVSCKPQSELDHVPVGVSISAVSVRQSFGDNWGVRVKIDNKTDAEFVLEGLTEKRLYAQSKGGTRVQAHALSIGRAKRFAVDPMRSRDCELLFVASPSAPEELHLNGRVVPLPAVTQPIPSGGSQ